MIMDVENYSGFGHMELRKFVRNIYLTVFIIVVIYLGSL